MKPGAAPDMDTELGEVEVMEDAEADGDARADFGAANGDEDDEDDEDDEADEADCGSRSFFAARFGFPPLSTSAASNIGRVQKRGGR